MSTLVEETSVNDSTRTQDTTTAGSKPADLGMIHPLKFPWTLWYSASLSNGKRPSTTAWGENMKEVFTFDTVEDFWRMYNNIAPASSLSQGCDFYLFKQGIQPKWEDPRNAKGGKWTIMVNRKNNLDTLWLWTMLACIGQVLEDELDQEHVCGCVVNIRKQDKIVIWLTDSEADDANVKIGHKLKQALELPESVKINFSNHFDKTKNVHDL